MENTDTPIEKEEATTVVESVAEETTEVNGEQPVAEPTSSEETSVEKKEDEVVPPTKSMNEQENVTDTSSTVTPTCLSPGRLNVPLKEVNESEKEESTVVSNGTENNMSKKRELEQEDEQPEETTNDNDERTIDQTKKIKITDSTETPIIETKESEKNIMVNGNTAVEV